MVPLSPITARQHNSLNMLRQSPLSSRRVRPVMAGNKVESLVVRDVMFLVPEGQWRYLTSAQQCRFCKDILNYADISVI